MTGSVIRLMLANSSRRSNQRYTGRCGPAITCTEAPDVRWTDDGVAVGHRDLLLHLGEHPPSG
jgi:hypothetical protein